MVQSSSYSKKLFEKSIRWSFKIISKFILDYLLVNVFIILKYSQRIPLNHKISTKFKKAMENIAYNLIKLISNYNICHEIKAE